MPMTEGLKHEGGGKVHDVLMRIMTHFGYDMENAMNPNLSQARLAKRSLMRVTPEVYPLVVIMGGALVGIVGFITYMGISRNDLAINKNRRTVPAYDLKDYDLEHPKPNKLFVLNQKYEADPKLRQLAEEMKKA